MLRQDYLHYLTTLPLVSQELKKHEGICIKDASIAVKSTSAGHEGTVGTWRGIGTNGVNVFKRKELLTNCCGPAHNLEAGGNFMTW